MAIYEDPVVKAVIDTIKDNNSTIKTYYQGDPFMIPRDYLPACIVSKNETTIPNLDSEEDEHQMDIVITVVTDIRENFLASDIEGKDNLLVPGYSELYDIMEGRNSTTLKLKTTSIANIVRANRAMGTSNRALDVDLRGETRINYGITLGKRGENTLSIEANLFTTLHFIQIR